MWDAFLCCQFAPAGEASSAPGVLQVSPRGPALPKGCAEEAQLGPRRAAESSSQE